MADDTAEVAYAVIFDGVSRIFVDNEGLTTAWAVAAGFVSTYAGLVPPSSLPWPSSFSMVFSCSRSR